MKNLCCFFYLTAEVYRILIGSDIPALADKVRFSDPMSAESLEPLKQRLMSKVDELKDAMNDQPKTIALINEVELLLDERNKKCKLMK